MSTFVATSSFEELPAAAVIAPLLEQVGLDGQYQLTRLAGGRNNRVYRLATPTAIALLKWYFRNSADDRDRLGAEYAFAEFAWSHGVRDVPQPLACDRAAKLGLFEFIAGRTLAASEVSASRVEAAADFVCRLNAHAGSATAATLPLASEPCFSMRQHCDCVERRVAALQHIDGEGRAEEEARRFVDNELVPAWYNVCTQVGSAAKRTGIDCNDVLKSGQRCLSPSDFGFHNALITADQTVRFIDLEYAGWDDPGRLISDFFCQVEVPVSRDHLSEFSTTVLAGFADPPWQRERMRLLLPIYRLKWCTIVLNDFLPAGHARRTFSGAADVPERLVQQLDKSRRVLAELADDLKSLA